MVSVMEYYVIHDLLYIRKGCHITVIFQDVWLSRSGYNKGSYPYDCCMSRGLSRISFFRWKLSHGMIAEGLCKQPLEIGAGGGCTPFHAKHKLFEAEGIL